MSAFFGSPEKETVVTPVPEFSLWCEIGLFWDGGISDFFGTESPKKRIVGRNCGTESPQFLFQGSRPKKVHNPRPRNSEIVGGLWDFFGTEEFRDGVPEILKLWADCGTESPQSLFQGSRPKKAQFHTKKRIVGRIVGGSHTILAR